MHTRKELFTKAEPAAITGPEMPICDKEPASKRPFGGGVWVALALTVLLDTVAELCWKAGVARAGGSAPLEILCRTAGQPLFIFAMLLFVPKYFNWMYVLSRADLTYAKPITSLSYVTVLVFSAWLLHEPITVAKVLGIALILLGVWLVGRTDACAGPGGES